MTIFYSFHTTNSFFLLDVRNSLLPVEFNFWWDPEAAFIVLDSFKCPKTVAPRECCLEESLAISLVGKMFFSTLQKDSMLFPTKFAVNSTFITSLILFSMTFKGLALQRARKAQRTKYGLFE